MTQDRIVKAASLKAMAFQVFAAMLALMIMSATADARRKFSVGSGSKSSATDAAKGGAASSMGGFQAALVGASVSRAGKQRLQYVHDLPQSDETKLADGRHVHIGRLSRTFFGTKLVGYVSATEYVEFTADQLAFYVGLIGYDSVAEFETFIAARAGQTKSPSETSVARDIAPATEPAAAVSSGGPQTLFVAGGSLALAGFFGFCLISWLRTRSSAPPSVAAPAATRLPRMAAPQPLATQPTAPMSRPRITAPIATGPATPAAVPRRAPRDLQKLIGGTTPSFGRS